MGLLPGIQASNNQLDFSSLMGSSCNKYRSTVLSSEPSAGLDTKRGKVAPLLQGQTMPTPIASTVVVSKHECAENKADVSPDKHSSHEDNGLFKVNPEGKQPLNGDISNSDVNAEKNEISYTNSDMEKPSLELVTDTSNGGPVAQSDVKEDASENDSRETQPAHSEVEIVHDVIVETSDCAKNAVPVPDLDNDEMKSGDSSPPIKLQENSREFASVKEESMEDLNSHTESDEGMYVDENNEGSDDRPGTSMSNKMATIGELAVTKPAPEFETQAVTGGTFKTIKLSDYRGKYVVLFFYPLDFTFVCPTEIIAFSDRAEEFHAIDCEVLACSTDSIYSHLAWVNTPRKMGGLGPMKIPLLSDKTAIISKKYGCLKEDEGVAFRGLYIIDASGNLRQITINDLPVGRSVDETLRLVQAFQFTDKHGEVCPAGWKPGKDTMKPEPTASKDYFNKSH